MRGLALLYDGFVKSKSITISNELFLKFLLWNGESSVKRMIIKIMIAKSQKKAKSKLVANKVEFLQTEASKKLFLEFF